MKNVNENILKVIDLLEKRAKVASDKNTKIKIWLNSKDLHKFKIKDGDLEKIFLLLKQNGQIKILNDLIFDFNKLTKKISKSVIEKLFGRKEKKDWSNYDKALFAVRFDKEFKKMKKDGEIKIILTNLDKLNDYRKRIEEINNTVAHYLEFKKNREIILDGKKKLSKPDFDSENDNFFNFIYNNPNKKINIPEIEASIGALRKRPINILADLGFTGDIKKMFFPAVSNKAIEFINPITEKYLKDNRLKKLKLNKK